MADPTRPATDLHNQPADQRLINQRPELQDPSLKGQVPGPQPTSDPAPAVAQEPPPVPQNAGDDPNAPNTAGNDSKGQPRPHGQGGSDSDKHGYGDARQQEREKGLQDQGNKSAADQQAIEQNQRQESVKGQPGANTRPALKGRR